MKKVIQMGVPVAGAAMLIGLTVSPAQAASYSGSCSTTGASGSVAVSGWSPGGKEIPNVTLKVKDTLADGHHARVRLAASYADGVSYFPWHANYDGNGTTKEWDTYVSGPGNIFDVGVQVARFEGDDMLNYCTKWIV
ncbi:hypothetical protein ACFYPB_31100 [Streptomyces olivaceoviridis]|uniref:hypothetical protein n=1 Tax=Streptomyces olivaceoviridis TaxID=1921 RepID=UPI00369E4201